MPEILLTVSTFLFLFFLMTTGTLYVLMALELKRKGRPTKFLSLSFDLRARMGIVREVFRNYRKLKEDEDRFALLPRLFWVSLALSILFVVLTFICLATAIGAAAAAASRLPFGRTLAT